MALVFGQYTPTFVAPCCIYLVSDFFFFSVCAFLFFEIHRNGRAGLFFLSRMSRTTLFFSSKKKRKGQLYFCLVYHITGYCDLYQRIVFPLFALLASCTQFTRTRSIPFQKVSIFSSTYFLPFLLCNGGTLYRVFFLGLNTTLYTCIKFLFLFLQKKKIFFSSIDF